METSLLLPIVLSVDENCIPGTENPIVAIPSQCAVLPGTILKQMLTSMACTWNKAISIFTSFKETVISECGERIKTLIGIEGNAHSLALCCAQQVVINNLIRLVRPLTFQKGVKEP